MEIKILKMELENFKCHRHLVLDFQGEDGSIFGDNGTGKTSVYDALTWMLFGKDSLGRGETMMEVKPLDEEGGVRDHQAITRVEVLLMVDGREICLCRENRECWATREEGSRFEGNRSRYYWDGVPMRRGLFQEKVAQIMPEETFRMLTSVKYFPEELPWQQRRKLLCKMAGVLSDREILEGESRFERLREAAGSDSLETLKRKLKARRQSLENTGNDIPARLSELEKTLQSLPGEEENWEEKLKAIQDKLAKQNLAADQSRQRRSQQIRELQLAIRELDAENLEFLSTFPDGKKTKQALEFAENTENAMEESLQRCRREWGQVSAEEFRGGRCPTCGQDLPGRAAREARDSFEREKERRLRGIEATAEDFRKRKQEAAHQAQTLKKQLETMKSQPEEMPGYREKREELRRKLEQIPEEKADPGEDLRAEEKRLLEAQSRKQLRRYTLDRQEQLRQELQAAQQELEKIRSLENLLDEFGRFQAKLLEQQVNRLFRIARFRLFRIQVDGSMEERCDVVYDGVPYGSLNSGMKVNVGIDILNSLGDFFGVRVPLFIDNAEAVTALEQSRCQRIRLVVSPGEDRLRLRLDRLCPAPF